MCIAFLYVNPNASEKEWKVVLINNRDEAYERPTIQADFKENGLIYGQDMRDGGTWLALDKKNGRIGVLLNIAAGTPKENPKSRGTILLDWLNGNENAIEFSRNLSENDSYNGFSVVLIDSLSKDNNTVYYTNRSEEKTPEVLKSGHYGFSNSIRQRPYLKVGYGLAKFENVLSGNMESTVENRERIINECLQILQDRTQNFPDPVMKEKSPPLPDAILEGLSSCFVQLGNRYGTRSQTVVLIDGKNRTTLCERSMVDIPENITEAKWDTKRFDFELNAPSSVL